MSYVPRRPVRPGDPVPQGVSNEPIGKGSVRAARERLAAAQLMQESGAYGTEPYGVVEQSYRENPLVSQYSSYRSQPPQRPIPVQPAPMPAPIPAYAREEPSFQNQWPLPNDLGVLNPLTSNPIPSQPVLQQPQPTRPYRPPQPPQQELDQTLAPPTFLDTRESTGPEDIYDQSQEDWQDGYLSSFSQLSARQSRPMTGSSQTSSSSLGSIPDFPYPGGPSAAPRRSQPLGPPPSSRRGPSSFYSQVSFVSPIKEESENRGSVASYASSNVIPSKVQEFYMDGEGESPSDDEFQVYERQDSRAGFAQDASNLVRQASLGKRGKPSLTTIKSGEALRAAAAGATGAEISGAGNKPNPSISPYSSEESLVKRNGGGRVGSPDEAKSPSSFDVVTGTRSPTSPISHTGSQSPILASREKSLEGAAAAFAASAMAQPIIQGSLAQRVGQRRPPKLDVDAVRQAEARGSLTSLPDLIRRATRLAANLDRGKTASRLGMDWMEGVSPAARSDPEKENTSPNNQPHGSFNAMLQSFPPPGTRANGQIEPRAGDFISQFDPQMDNAPQARNLDDSASSYKPRRQCCGMSLRAFITLMVMLVLLIGAAVAVPVVLIVIPQKSSSAGDAITMARAACSKTSPCLNGGEATVLPSGTCGCICTNGFTGLHCDIPATVDCAAMTVPGFQNGATVGSEIPQLVASSRAEFSIPLDATRLLSTFAGQGMTCTSENALVTFRGFPTSKRSAGPPWRDGASLAGLVARNLAPRQEANEGVLTNGLLIAAPTSTPTKSVPLTTLMPPSAVVGVAGVAQGTAAPATNSTSIRFAKVAVLFVLQDSGAVGVAATAQERLGAYFTTAARDGSSLDVAMNITLGSGYFVDLWDWRLQVVNGTVYGKGVNGRRV